MRTQESIPVGCKTARLLTVSHSICSGVGLPKPPGPPQDADLPGQTSKKENIEKSPAKDSGNCQLLIPVFKYCFPTVMLTNKSIVALEFLPIALVWRYLDSVGSNIVTLSKRRIQCQTSQIVFPRI